MADKILLIEDDLSISEMVEDYLTKEGFAVDCAFDGEEAIRKFMQSSYDLILLDLMLPKLNGMEFLRIVREKSLIPILIMSAKDGDADKALGLGFGADDYIAKPFSMIELCARIRAAIRRATLYSGSQKEAENKTITVHEITIDLDNFAVSKQGQEIKITSKEFHILKLFFQHPQKAFTKEQIYQMVWQDDFYGEENVINVHIRRLREKIEDDPSNPQYIKTLWGIGYKLGDF